MQFISDLESDLPPNIDVIALEAGEIWARVARKYRHLYNSSKELLTEFKKLTAINIQLTDECKKLKEQLENLKKPLSEKTSKKNRLADG